MKHFSFENIEKELNIKLPEFYKKVIQNYPFEDIKKYKFVYNSIYIDEQKIIDINKKIRQNGYQNKKWDKNFYIFGESGCDNYLFINLSFVEVKIYFTKNTKKFNPQKIENNLLEDSFERFISLQKKLQEIHDNP